MVFWLEVTSTDSGREVRATVTLASPVGTVRVYIPSQSAAATATLTNGSRFDLMVPDSPVIWRSRREPAGLAAGAGAPARTKVGSWG